MAGRFRVALEGFTDFERNSLIFCFRMSGTRERGYELVGAPQDADFVVADSDSVGVCEQILKAGRVERTVFVGHVVPDGAGAYLPRPIDPTHILQKLDALAEARDRDTALLENAQEDSTAKKAHARKASRQARLDNAPALPDTFFDSSDVLVLDENEVSRTQLCALLEGFGFCVHRTHDAMRAAEMLATGAYAAAFIDVVFGTHSGTAAMALCQRIKAPAPSVSGRSTWVVMTSGNAKPADRVRAELAGCDLFLPKPLSRGDAARSLEACGVRLPADTRGSDTTAGVLT